MPDDSSLLLGVDVGTGGVRAMAVTRRGEVVAEASIAFDRATTAASEDRREQPPEAWWDAFRRATASVVGQLAEAGIAGNRLAAMAVDGTSGTIVPLDADGRPLRPALMYNDPRGTVEAETLNLVAGRFCEKLGYRFASSFALAKIAWIAGHEPELFRRTARFAHQADYLVGRLIDGAAPTDYSNALKTGYDLVDQRWPDWLESLPGVAARLPAVVAPGTPIGEVSARAAGETGLPQHLAIVAGATDGTAACLASGVRRPGDYNATLGSTLVFKGLSERICRHPQGLIYCHKLPGGLWLPGAASNTGAQWIAAQFPGADPRSLDTLAGSRLPCPVVAYPLTGTGERFPFLSETAEGFFPEEGTAGPALRYAACLQGVAFLERLAYDVLDRVAGTSGRDVYATGGGSRSDLWMQVRADVTRRAVHRPACPESAFGAAILAASSTCYTDLPEAIAGMVRIDRTFPPDARRTQQYGELYQQFLEQLRERGYL